MSATAEVVVGSSAAAVADARRLVRSTFPDADQEVVEDLRLIVTELLTNALLHGEPPVVLRLKAEGDHARVEVEDHGRELPVNVRRSGDAMTGRGLALVTALAQGWGVEPGDEGGKRLWAQVPMQPDRGLAPAATDFDLDELLASWPDDDAEQRELFTIRLGSVPTGLLLAAKAHIDNVVRELTLMQTGGTSAGERLTAGTTQLIEAVTQDFAEARAAIKRQAIGAAARGEPTTELVLHLPVACADAGERYLRALEEVDRYAHSARLLTLAPPASHQAFRRWYVQALVDQLRAAARGLPQPAPEPFPQVLAAEVDRLSWLQENSDRL